MKTIDGMPLPKMDDDDQMPRPMVMEPVVWGHADVMPRPLRTQRVVWGHPDGMPRPAVQ